MTKKFRFGVQCAVAGSAKEWREKARKAEALGYSTIFMPDHFGEQLAPVPALATAAEATDRLRIGALVFDNDYKHPAILAKEAATLDVLSEGRLEFGIGAGWLRTDYDQLGLVYDRPGVRIERLQEGLQIIKACWSNEVVNFAGTHYTVTGYNGMPKPVQQPGPPVLIGGGGQRVLSYAAREADIVGITASVPEGAVTANAAKNATAEEVDKKVAWIKEAAGVRFDQIELNTLTFFLQVTNDRDKTVSDLAAMFGLTPEQGAGTPLALVGTHDQIAETLQQRRERFGVSYITVQDVAMDDFGPVVERLAGT
jgi:probable F420-dependent oxidoreductase